MNRPNRFCVGICFGSVFSLEVFLVDVGGVFLDSMGDPPSREGTWEIVLDCRESIDAVAALLGVGCDCWVARIFSIDSRLVWPVVLRYRRLLWTIGDVSRSKRCVPSLLGRGGVCGVSAFREGEHSITLCGSNKRLSASSTSLRACSTSISGDFGGLKLADDFLGGGLKGGPRGTVRGDLEGGALWPLSVSTELETEGFVGSTRF